MNHGNQLNHSSIPVFVGLDYHLGSVQVCTLNAEGLVLGNRSCPNDWQAISQSVHRQAGHDDAVHAAVESCAGAANLADQLVSLAGWSVNMAHPGFVRRMKQNPDKSDYSDARMLADLRRIGYLPRVWIAPEPVRELRKLVRYRQQLIEQRKSQKLRITAILREQRLVAPAQTGRRWSRSWLGWLGQTQALSGHNRWIIDRHLERLEGLKREIAAAEERLAQVTSDDPLVQQLQQQPGIGPVTSWVMRAMIGRFDRFGSGKQLARFCGVCPCNASSGDRQADAGLIRAGDPLLRVTLIEAGHRLIRHVPRWGQLAASLSRRGKKPCQIVAAVVNRWIRWLFHQIKDLKEMPMPQPVSQTA